MDCWDQESESPLPWGDLPLVSDALELDSSHNVPAVVFEGHPHLTVREIRSGDNAVSGDVAHSLSYERGNFTFRFARELLLPSRLPLCLFFGRGKAGDKRLGVETVPTVKVPFICAE